MRYRKGLIPFVAAICLVGSAGYAWAGKADVVAVEVVRAADGSYRFNVSVLHADTGWSHYADRWEVVAPDEAVLATRVLHHPHVGQQPFTRSLGGVRIPGGITSVAVRARDSVHGYGGTEMTVEVVR
ncbi:MAG: hypothetical protein RX317_04715 [bacterium]|nr:hypothetical protein [bacterium]